MSPVFVLSILLLVCIVVSIVAYRVMQLLINKLRIELKDFVVEHSKKTIVDQMITNLPSINPPLISKDVLLILTSLQDDNVWYATKYELINTNYAIWIANRWYGLFITLRNYQDSEDKPLNYYPNHLERKLLIPVIKAHLKRNGIE